MYEKGDGVRQDRAAALSWYQQALAVNPSDEKVREKVSFLS